MLEHPAAAKFRSHVMDGDWNKVRLYDFFLSFFWYTCVNGMIYSFKVVILAFRKSFLLTVSLCINVHALKFKDALYFLKCMYALFLFVLMKYFKKKEHTYKFENEMFLIKIVEHRENEDFVKFIFCTNNSI